MHRYPTAGRAGLPFRLCTLALALAAASAQADEPAELPTLEITGQHIQEADVTSETLEHYQATDLEDVFASEPEVSVGGGHSVAQKLYLRGLEDTMVNISIDGAQQVGQTFHHTGRINVEPELLKAVDVKAGTPDALAGPGALGGAIRFETKDPEDLLRPGESAGALLKTTYFSNAEGFKGNGTLFGRLNDAWSGMLMATYQDLDDYEDGNGDTVPATGARQSLGFGKVVGHLTEAQTLRLSYERREDTGLRNQRPQWQASSWNPSYPLENVRETWNVGYELAPSDNPLLHLEVSAYHTENQLEQNVIGRWGIYRAQTQSWGGDVRNTSRLGGHELTYGVDYRRDSLTAGPGSDPDANEQEGKVYGVFVQDYWSLGERWLLGLGGRYDRYQLDGNLGERYRESGFSPNASLRFQATDDLALWVSHARAFRGPQIRDGFKVDIAPLDPALKPEKARSNEVSFDYISGGWLLSGKYYRSTIQDAIGDPEPRPRIYENAGDPESRGYLLETAYRWSQLSVGMSYHHNDTDLNDGYDLNMWQHNGLGTTLGDTWTLSADYRFSESLEMGWQGRFVERVSMDTLVGEVDKPGYGVQDLYANWMVLDDERLTLSLTVKNLFDKQYLDHASNGDFEAIPGYEGVIGAYEPGREIRLGMTMRF